MLLDPSTPRSDRPEASIGTWERTRRYLNLVLNDPSYSVTALYISYAVMSAIVLSTFSNTLESMPELQRNPAMVYFFKITEYVVISIFTMEYLLRLIVHEGNRCSFVIEPLNMVDLLAILPFYAELALVDSDFNAAELRVMRVLRILRLFRLLKLVKYSTDLKMFLDVLARSYQSLKTLVFLLSLLILIFSSLVWYIEKGEWDEEEAAFLRSDGLPSPFISIPTTFWWGVVTMTTVGYGDIFPIEPLGKLIAAIAMLLGILTIALPVGVIGSNFGEVYSEYQRAAKKKLVVPGSTEEKLNEIAESIETHTKELEELFNMASDVLRLACPKAEERQKHSIVAIQTQLSIQSSTLQAQLKGYGKILHMQAVLEAVRMP